MKEQNIILAGCSIDESTLPLNERRFIIDENKFYNDQQAAAKLGMDLTKFCVYADVLKVPYKRSKLTGIRRFRKEDLELLSEQIREV